MLDVDDPCMSNSTTQNFSGFSRWCFSRLWAMNFFMMSCSSFVFAVLLLLRTYTVCKASTCKCSSTCTWTWFPYAIDLSVTHSVWIRPKFRPCSKCLHVPKFPGGTMRPSNLFSINNMHVSTKNIVFAGSNLQKILLTPNSNILSVKKCLVKNVCSLVDVTLRLQRAQEAARVAIFAIQTIQVALVVVAVGDVACRIE